MATWEDGPEYAPRERPQSFDGPSVAPLEDAPVVAQPAAGAPEQRPTFDQPSGPVAPLASYVPAPEDQRDPSRPFAVDSSALTGDSVWGSVHWNATQPFPTSAPQALAPVAATPATPNGSWSAVPSWPAPEQPLQVHGGSAPAPTGFPSPGTPDWFSPPPAYGQQRPGGKVDAKAVVEAATPGLCICLAIGGLIYVLAPIMLVLGVVLSTRVRVAQGPVRIAFRSAAALVALIAFVGLFSDAAAASGWWNFVGLWSLLICWVTLIVLLTLVFVGLRRAAAPPPAGPPTWR